MILVTVGKKPARDHYFFAFGSAFTQKIINSFVIVDGVIVRAVNNKKAVVAAADDIAHSAVDKCMINFKLP